MTRLNRDKLGRAALSTLLGLTFFVFGAMNLGGCSDDEEDKKADEPVEPADDSGGDEVIIHTSMGDITIELLEEASPIACKNFVSYAEEGFYDGTIFIRIWLIKITQVLLFEMMPVSLRSAWLIKRA